MLRARLAFPLLLVALALGCRSTQPPPKKKDPQPAPASILLRFKPAPDLNPNDLGEPTPLDVRLYPLKDYTAFTEASFEQLWTEGEKVLGESLAGELTVLTFEPAPPEARPQAYEFTFPADARFLGVMGLFSAERKQGLEERKLVLSRDEVRTNTIYLTGHRIHLEGGQ